MEGTGWKDGRVEARSESRSGVAVGEGWLGYGNGRGGEKRGVEHRRSEGTEERRGGDG